MTEKIVELMINFPKPLIVFLTAALPIAELRGSIPVGILTLHLNPLLVFFLSILGNLFPIVFILLFLKKIDQFLCQRSAFFKKFFNWLYDHTYKKGGEKFKKWGALALIGFVAIPLPITGAYTGSVLALLFNVPFSKALPLIAVGVTISGIIVTFLTLTAAGLIN